MGGWVCVRACVNLRVGACHFSHGEHVTGGNYTGRFKSIVQYLRFVGVISWNVKYKHKFPHIHILYRVTACLRYVALIIMTVFLQNENNVF
jgi:hypothetical protein